MGMNPLLTTFFAVIVSFCINAQNNPSIHQFESEYFRTHQYTEPNPFYQKQSMSNNNCNLNKRVFGWHAYWTSASGNYNNYQWNLLSDLCYFSYEFNASTGAPTNTHSWATAAVIDSAQAHGTKVHLCVTMFNSTDHTAFFASTTAQSTLITNLVNAVESRNANGINVDFEGVSSTHKTALTTFMIRLADSLHTRIPGSELSIAMPAVDWGGTWDLVALNPYVDLFIIMGYDYYYGGSTTAGPTDPLYNFSTGYNYTLSKSITYYLSGGVSQSKLLLGLPYYGFEWQTSALTIPSSTLSTGTSKTYAAIKANGSGFYSDANKYWDPNSLSPCWAYSNGGLFYQAWVNDARSMSRRFDLVNIRNIGGIGIWALGYDNGYPDFWDLIADKFSDCAVIPCSDTIWDLGGPTRNHYINEDFIYTIAPDGASAVSLSFSSFALEAGFDSLYIYDGNSIASPLIGGYSGNVNPGVINSSGNDLTIKFHSDGATNSAGWSAIWMCSTDNIPPTTSVDTILGWKTQDFPVIFSDSDNVAIDQKFWQVLGFNGIEWKANYRAGFHNENFNNNMPVEYNSYAGNWQTDGAHLIQADSSNSNTILSTPLYQDDGTSWLYHWKMQFGAADANNNRRAGMHYFCDNPSATNRGNGYFAYYRLDNQTIQMYRVSNNAYTMQIQVPYAFAENVWYDLKILYDPSSGDHRTWVNNVEVASWQDAVPFSSGSYISLRTGNTKALYDDIKVYRNRQSNETISVGSDSMKMAQWCNPNPATPACKIKSLVLNHMGLFSSLEGTDVNIDYTPPIAPSYINDYDLSGSGDTDTLFASSATNNNALCNSAVDVNSGISTYYFNMGNYCMDLSCGSYSPLYDTSGVAGTFTNNGNYYTFVYAVNGAGLASGTTCSDGIYFEIVSSTADLANTSLIVFPNPAESYIVVQYSGSKEETLSLYSSNGIEIFKISIAGPGSTQIDIGYLASGVYMIRSESGFCSFFVKR